MRLFDEIQELWDALPKEVKVSSYIIVAYLLSSFIIPFVNSIKVLDPRVWLAVANFLLVVVVELKKRIE